MRPCCGRYGESGSFLDRIQPAAYRGPMRDIPADDTPGLDKDPATNERGEKFLPPDALSPVLDPDFVPDDDPTPPEEKRAREHPEETGS